MAVIFGGDVLQRRQVAACVLARRRNEVVSVAKDAVRNGANLAEEGSLLVLAHLDRQAERLHVGEEIGRR
jgi:hypothetical protein